MSGVATTDQRVLSRHWAETNEDRAREYRRMARYYRDLAKRYEARARHHDAVADADKEVAHG